MGVGASDAHRWRSALTLLGRMERDPDVSRTLRRRSYRIEGAHALRASLEPEDLRAPLTSMARQVSDGAVVIRARCRADVVRLGKFDVEDVVRFRAFHVLDVATPSALRVQGEAVGGKPGVERDLAARRQITVHAPDLAPRLLGAGVDDRKGVAYLRESIVRGRHPRNPDEVEALVPTLVAKLGRLYDGVGVEPVRLSSVVSGRLVERLSDLVRGGLLPVATQEAVSQLVARDRHVEVSLGHGDLVRTNILRGSDGDVVLVDWEYARSMPILFDLAKPVFLSRSRANSIQVLEEALKRLVATSRDSYSIHEQLALAIAQMLSWSAHRAERAEAAGRSELFERDTRDRIALLEQLLP